MRTSELDRIQVVDVSRDGKPDLVVLDRLPGTERIRVFRNDGAGGFFSTPTELVIPEGPDAAPVGFAPIVTGEIDGKPRIDLAVVTARRLFLASLRDDASVFELLEISPLLGAGPAITSVASGDFDGDGVQDLAVADSGAIRLLRQKPRLR